GVNLTLPNAATCIGGNANGNGWIPIGVEVRLAGLPGPDIDGPSCSTLHQNTTASRFTDCYVDPNMIREWKQNTSPIPPEIQDVNLNGPSSACRFDMHFTTVATGCSGGLTAHIDWGTRALPHGVYTVTVGGSTQTVNGPASPTGDWTFSGVVNPAAS